MLWRGNIQQITRFHGPWKYKTTMSGKGEGGENGVLKEGDTVNGNANTKARLEKH